MAQNQLVDGADYQIGYLDFTYTMVLWSKKSDSIMVLLKFKDPIRFYITKTILNLIERSTTIHQWNKNTKSTSKVVQSQ